MRLIIYALIISLAGFFCCIPVIAAHIPYGEPVYDATIKGDNELTPGKAVPLKIEFANIGHVPEKLYDLVDPISDLSSPVIGRGITLTLHSGNSPIDVISTPLNIPILPPGMKVPVIFPVIIPESASEGDYTLELEVDSSYIDSVAMQGKDNNVYHYQVKNETLKIPFSIKPVVKVRVNNVKGSNLSPGLDGKIIANITNIGQYTGKYASAEIVTSKYSPLTVYQGSYFLGEFKPGETRTVSWKVQVNDQIDSSNIPAVLAVVYEDKNGQITKSMPVTIGIPVSNGPKFTITYEKPNIEPGGSVSVKVKYNNVGDTAANNASTKIVPISPVSSIVTSVLLGDILPNRSVEVVYELTLDGSALVKPYGVLTDIKYRSQDGMVVISDPMRIDLNTVPQSILSRLLSPLSLVIALGILLILVYLIMRRQGRLV